MNTSWFSDQAILRGACLFSRCCGFWNPRQKQQQMGSQKLSMDVVSELRYVSIHHLVIVFTEFSFIFQVLQFVSFNYLLLEWRDNKYLGARLKNSFVFICWNMNNLFDNLCSHSILRLRSFWPPFISRSLFEVAQCEFVFPVGYLGMNAPQYTYLHFTV